MEWFKERLQDLGYAAFAVIILATVVLGLIYIELIVEKIVG